MGHMSFAFITPSAKEGWGVRLVVYASAVFFAVTDANGVVCLWTSVIVDWSKALSREGIVPWSCLLPLANSCQSPVLFQILRLGPCSTEIGLETGLIRQV